MALSRSFYMLLTLVIRHSFSDWRRFLLWSFASEKKLPDPNWCNVKYCWEVSCPTQSYTSCKSIDQVLGWDISVSWLLPDIKVLVIFQIFDILRKVKHPKHAAETAYHNVNLLFEDHPQFGCNCSSIIPPLLMLATIIYDHMKKRHQHWEESGLFGQ